MRKAFTLLELLIVVSMIAILSAIALPNFMEAQTRQKVARSSADLRVLSAAIESYAIDNGTYPTAAINSTGVPSLSGPSLVDSSLAGSGWVSYRYIRLTTPIAYITKIYEDPFASAGFAVTAAQLGLNYDSYDYINALLFYPGGVFDSATANWRGAGISSGSMWRLAGAGPDELNTFGGSYVGAIPASSGIVDYDPTNGMVSKGDIVRIGSKPGPINPSRLPAIDRINNVYNEVIP
jgi:prepilin-type N-terminal cleavage/methylation domain-containing protein